MNSQPRKHSNEDVEVRLVQASERLSLALKEGE